MSNSSETESTAIASEDVVALLAMLIIPLAVIFAVLTAVEKITGLSILAGVEWVGEKTLKLFDWCIRTVKQWLGVEIKNTNRRVPVHTLRRKYPQKTGNTQDVRTALLDPDTDMYPDDASEPVIADSQVPLNEQRAADLDFSSAETDIETVVVDGLITDGAEAAVIAPESLRSEAGVNLDSNPTAVDNNLQSFEDLDNTFNDLELELKTFFPDTEDWIDNKSDEHISDLDTGEAEKVFSELNSNEELKNDISATDTLHSEPVYKTREMDASEDEMINFVDPGQSAAEAVNKVEPDARFQEPQYPLETETFKADSLANDDDFINRAIQAAKNEVLHSKNHSASDTRLTTESDLNSGTQALNKEPANLPREPDFMIKALQAAKDKETGSAADMQTNEGLKNVENPGSYSSLLNRAEKTTANILSSFSQRFSKSFSLHQKTEYQLPSIELLQRHEQSVHAYTTDELDIMSRSVERVLNDYKVSAEVVGAYPGPIITRFELSLAPGVKVSRVNGLAKDLARAMLVTSVRVVEIIEGTPYIGLEIPNQERELVSFREIISSDQFQQAKSPITLALGKDVSGQTVVANLAKMPHLLVAGTTGSGKSVAINTMILSMLYKATPDQVRMIMVDPKMLELSIYEGIPHLLTPVVTDMKEAQNALRWAVAEMERRYKLMSKVGVRNLAGFNQMIKDAEARGETIRDPLFELIVPLEEGETFPVLTTLPSIVIIIDELADMMMIVGKKVEELIARLAQKARAAGIHLILATQRPSVDVLTGLIKANIPTRISFQVSSRIDSRTILDQGGAEALLGNGDMLYLPSGTSVPTRSHGAFVDDHEVHAVVDYLKSLGKANYLSEITREEPAENTTTLESVQDETDELYDDAVSFVLETGRASISSVQRRFKVGYNRAARMIDQMEDENIVSEPEGNGSRRVLDRE
ncbi:DNA translocase FtsK [Methyloprofundus sedimenti]|uniref:DNA translocase FtsK n=1 Tax=Methyloprofundus sedimenti TaxID=1420851 RepID=UPI0018E96AA3|nr:DNA translocase FtsK [Methyloprofundus sedimenti]